MAFYSLATRMTAAIAHVRGYDITNEKNLKGVIENYMAAVYNDPRIIGVSFNYNWR